MFFFLTSPWIPALVLLLLAFGARLASRSWLAPAAFVGLLWSAAVWAPLLLTDYHIQASTLWIIVLFVFVVQLGTFVGEHFSSAPFSTTRQLHKEESNHPFPGARALRFCIFFALIAFAGSVYFIVWGIRRYDLEMSPVSLFALGHFVSEQRYHYGELEPWPVRLSVMWVYPAALLGGISFAANPSRRSRRWTLAPFLPALFVGTIVAARAGVLISLICWLSGYLAVKHWQSNGEYAIFTRRSGLAFIGLTVAAVCVFVCIDALRAFDKSTHTAFEITFNLQRFLKYVFGYLPAFSNWFHLYRPASPTFGACTFGGIFDLTGIQHRQVGLYDELTTLPGGEETNIYTALRGLIEDFTFLGTLFIVFVIGLIVGSVSNPASRSPWKAILCASGYYAFTLFSPIVSIFYFNGLVLAWLAGAMVLRSDFRAHRQHLPIVRMTADSEAQAKA